MPWPASGLPFVRQWVFGPYSTADPLHGATTRGHIPDERLPDAIATRLGEILDAHRRIEGPLLSILHAVQAEWGHLPPAAIPAIAQTLNLGRAELHGVASFCHDFRFTPAGCHVVKLCAAESCQAQRARLPRKSRRASASPCTRPPATGA